MFNNNKVYVAPKEESKDSSRDDGVTQTENNSKAIYLANQIEVWALGAAVVLGGQFYGWNTGFSTGFGTYAIGQILMGLAYICLMCCLAEITSTIPFAGGAFGLGRVCLGFYPGFIIGYLQLLEFVAYSSAVVVFCSEVLAPYFGTSRYCEWIFWAMYYGFTTAIVWKEDRTFWLFNVFLAVASLSLIIIYVLPSFSWVNFAEYAPLNVNYVDDPAVNAKTPVNNQWFVGGMRGFMEILPFTTWAYGGIESMAMTSAVMKDAQSKLPMTMIASMLTLFVTSMFLLFVIGSQPPGLAQTASTDYPMNYGFNRMFKTTDDVSIALILLPNFAMGYGFIPPSTRLVASLGQSRLFPSVFNLEDPKHERYALIFVQLLGILFCIIGFYSKVFADNLNNIAILAGFITYASILIGFGMLRGRFANLERAFRSPVGVPGAVFAAIVFTFGFFSVAAGFQYDNGTAILTNVGFIAVCTIYYYSPGGPHKRQILSDQETKVLFRMSVMNVNLRRKRGKPHRWFKQKFVTVRRLSKILDSDFLRRDSNVSSQGFERRNSLLSFISNRNSTAAEVEAAKRTSIRGSRTSLRGSQDSQPANNAAGTSSAALIIEPNNTTTVANIASNADPVNGGSQPVESAVLGTSAQNNDQVSDSDSNVYK